eukprot:scaffold244963_cov19-Tisochrysis_lutea.AAC.1
MVNERQVRNRLGSLSANEEWKKKTREQGSTLVSNRSDLGMCSLENSMLLTILKHKLCITK